MNNVFLIKSRDQTFECSVPLPGRYITVQRYREMREEGEGREYVMAVSEVDLIVATKKYASAEEKAGWAVTSSSTQENSYEKHGPQLALDGVLPSPSPHRFTHPNRDDSYCWTQVSPSSLC